MMRTHYCGYCGKPDHNRRTCPDRVEAEARYLEKYPESEAAKSILHRRASQKRKLSQRSCSYCHIVGHNRRGCTTLKTDRVAVQKRFTEYRQEFADITKRCGFGIGALIKIPVSDTWACDSYYIGMITKVKWGVVSHKYGSTSLRFNQTTHNENIIAEMRLIKVIDGEYQHHRNGWKPNTPGDTIGVHLSRFAGALPAAFPAYMEELNRKAQLNPERRTRWSAEILSPAAWVNVPSSYYAEELTYDVMRSYRFSIKHSARSWEKARVLKHSELWNGVYEKSEKEKTN